MSIDQKVIESVALLARIQVSDAQSVQLTDDINNILKLVDELQAVDTQNVEPMGHPTDAVQVLRDDAVSEVDMRDIYQKVAPATEDGLYLVPKVIE